MKSPLSRTKIENKEFFLEIILVLLVSFIWETIEHYLETTWPLVEWFAGVEFWANRIIFDGLFVLLGFLCIKKFPKYIWFTRIFSFSWLVIHIFVFPDSMYSPIVSLWNSVYLVRQIHEHTRFLVYWTFFHGNEYWISCDRIFEKICELWT